MEETLAQAAALFEGVRDSESYRKLVGIHAEISRMIIREYQSKGFTREEAFQLTVTMASKIEAQ